jgi:WD40 repeat protein
MLLSLRSPAARLLLAAVLLLAPALPVQAVSLAYGWGERGQGTAQFSNPRAIAVNPHTGDVYIAGIGFNSVQRFTATGSHVRTLGGAVVGKGPAEFNQPQGIAVDTQGNVYVADTGNHRIQKFNSKLDYLTQWGTPGTGNQNLNRPTAIAVDSNNNVFVSDTSNLRIVKYNSAGDYMTQWKLQPVPGHGGSIASCIAIGPNGNVVTYYPSARQFQLFDNSGNFIKSWFSHENGEVFALAVSELGDIYAAAYTHKRMDVYTSGGAYARSIVLTTYINRVNFNVRGLAWSHKYDTLYALDTQIDRVEVFNP